MNRATILVIDGISEAKFLNEEDEEKVTQEILIAKWINNQQT